MLTDVFSVEDQKELMRSDVTSLRLAVSQETFEKDTLQQSCADLRTQIKRLESEKTDLSHITQEHQQKLSGTEISLHVVVVM